MLPFPGVVSSIDISDRFYLDVEVKTLPRYFQFVSHKRSSTLVSTESSGTGTTRRFSMVPLASINPSAAITTSQDGESPTPSL
jgi:hypothetical protein